MKKKKPLREGTRSIHIGHFDVNEDGSLGSFTSAQEKTPGDKVEFEDDNLGGVISVKMMCLCFNFSKHGSTCEECGGIVSNTIGG